jgi:peptide chain release factor subunit 1
MRTLDRQLLRELADWSTDGFPVTSVYLDVDGRRYPRRTDYLVRLEDHLRKAVNGSFPKDHRRSVEADVEEIRRFVNERFERDWTRGLALFSCSGVGLWEDVGLPQPVRDRVAVAQRPHLLPLEALLESFETFCTALVDRGKARFFMTVGGQIQEVSEVLDDVPGWHDQGGWAQARLQRHIEDHVQRHLKHVAETLLRLKQRRGFDQLVLAGPEEAVTELERELHDYVRRTVLDKVSLPMASSADDVLAHAVELERDLEERREREATERLVSEVKAGTGRATGGFEDTLVALEANRVDTLVLASDLRGSGVRCTRCGHLAVAGDVCAVCGGPVEGVPDLVEEAVEAALR